MGWAVREGLGFPCRPETLNQPDEAAGLRRPGVDVAHAMT
jgi:hypothetical protein